MTSHNILFIVSNHGKKSFKKYLQTCFSVKTLNKLPCKTSSELLLRSCLCVFVYVSVKERER